MPGYYKPDTDSKVTYEIICTSDLEMFNTTLNEMCGDGWKVDGDIVITSTMHYVHYCQRMIFVEQVPMSTTRMLLEA